MTDWLSQSEALFNYTRDLRRDFHRHPELGLEEFRTAEAVTRELRQLGLEVSTGVGGTGVVGRLKGAVPGPVLLLRFDMDALPIQEETGAEYASQTPGVMHACGHDGHTSIGLTVARLLRNHAEGISGTIVFVFQPAEETFEGARGMIRDGLLENPRPDRALALHLWNSRPVGWLGIAPGPTMAASDSFSLRVIGKGGHGAAPHRGIDPILVAAQVITTAQSIVSRNVPPLESAVLSFGKIHGGEVFNVIPEEVSLTGTIRTYQPSIREHVLARFREVVQHVGKGLGAEIELNTQTLSPAVVNDPGATAQVQSVARRVLPESELDNDARTMGSEDMAFILDQIPGCYFFVGSANPEAGLDADHHHARFDFDEQVMPRAAALMAAAAVDFLKS
jgi:amidohydrolase